MFLLEYTFRLVDVILELYGRPPGDRYGGEVGQVEGGLLHVVLLRDLTTHVDLYSKGTKYISHSLKPIFHCDAKLLALGPTQKFALGIPTCWYLKTLKFAIPLPRWVPFFSGIWALYARVLTDFA